MIFIPGNYRRTRKDTGKVTTALEALLNKYPSEADLANTRSNTVKSSATL